MTRTPQVAARIAALCLTDSGESPYSVLLAMAVRGGLLVDLGLAGRLTQSQASVEVHTAPLGHAPTDSALAELGSLEGRSLDWWLDHSRIGLADLAAAETAAGAWRQTTARRWRRAPRYAVVATDRRDRDRELLAGSLTPETAGDVAVFAIAAAAGLAAEPRSSPGGSLLARAAAAGWLCRLVVDHLDEARVTGNAVGSATQTALRSTWP